METQVETTGNAVLSGPVKTLKAKAPKAVKPKAKAKAKAKPKTPAGDRLVPADLSKYHKDTVKKTAGGHPSVDSNDKLAVKLRGLTLDEVYSEASKVLNEPVKALKAKYEHLNAGMQRMNLGNRMRAA